MRFTRLLWAHTCVYVCIKICMYIKYMYMHLLSSSSPVVVLCRQTVALLYWCTGLCLIVLIQMSSPKKKKKKRASASLHSRLVCNLHNESFFANDAEATLLTLTSLPFIKIIHIYIYPCVISSGSIMLVSFLNWDELPHAWKGLFFFLFSKSSRLYSYARVCMRYSLYLLLQGR